ncbi:hypothetical protein GH870_31635 [Bacillus thuringiensis]|nr:hypothetical protein [Bacillus thuringiensis]MRC81610.1 hypothetical protein [Bacillus thuringiensis]MRD22379.1 hypothetical protein [Bacillus thuringiensis]
MSKNPSISLIFSKIGTNLTYFTPSRSTSSFLSYCSSASSSSSLSVICSSVTAIAQGLIMILLSGEMFKLIPPKRFVIFTNYDDR